MRAQEATLILKKSKEDVVKKIIVTNNVSQPTTPIANSVIILKISNNSTQKKWLSHSNLQFLKQFLMNYIHIFMLLMPVILLEINKPK